MFNIKMPDLKDPDTKFKVLLIVGAILVAGLFFFQRRDYLVFQPNLLRQSLP